MITSLVVLALAGCVTSRPEGGLRRDDQIRDCPPGMILICESARPQAPSSGGAEEIPGYDRCYCEVTGIN